MSGGILDGIRVLDVASFIAAPAAGTDDGAMNAAAVRTIDLLLLHGQYTRALLPVRVQLPRQCMRMQLCHACTCICMHARHVSQERVSSSLARSESSFTRDAAVFTDHQEF